MWYLMEIMAREHDDFVWIFLEKDASVWNYNRYLITHVPYYYRSCWPVKMMPTHTFGSNKFVRKVVKPVLYAAMDKAARSRTLIHDVPENEMLDVLACYGIQKDTLPTGMGGPVDLDAWSSLWVAQRRAIEMEEI